MCAVAPQTVSSSSSKKCSTRSPPGLAIPRAPPRPRAPSARPGRCRHARTRRGGTHRSARPPATAGPGQLGGCSADHRDDVAATDDRGEVIELTDDLDGAGVETDLLMGFAQGGGGLRLAGIEAPAREADLAGVVAQGRGSTGEQHASVAVGIVGEQDEHAEGAPGEVGVARLTATPRDAADDLLGRDPQRVGERGNLVARRPHGRAGNDLVPAGAVGARATQRVSTRTRRVGGAPPGGRRSSATPARDRATPRRIPTAPKRRSAWPGQPWRSVEGHRFPG